jgi:hypothetical protein
MFRRLPSLTLRARLLLLGGGAVLSLVLVAATSAYVMTGIRTKAHTSSSAQAQAIVLSHAYEGWIRNDDQNNMYAAVVALRDPKQHKLAEVTWGESASAYHQSAADLAKVRRMLKDPRQLAVLARIQKSLASFNTFSLKQPPSAWISTTAASSNLRRGSSAPSTGCWGRWTRRLWRRSMRIRSSIPTPSRTWSRGLRIDHRTSISAHAPGRWSSRTGPKTS